MSTWSQYVSALTKGVGIDEAGERVGVAGSTISRWRTGKIPAPRNPAEAASLALAFDGDVLEAFVAAGYLTPEQAQRPARRDLRAVPAEDLAEEVSRRLTNRSSGAGRTDFELRRRAQDIAQNRTPERILFRPVNESIDAARAALRAGEHPGEILLLLHFIELDLMTAIERLEDDYDSHPRLSDDIVRDENGEIAPESVPLVLEHVRALGGSEEIVAWMKWSLEVSNGTLPEGAPVPFDPPENASTERRSLSGALEKYWSQASS